MGRRCLREELQHLSAENSVQAVSNRSFNTHRKVAQTSFHVKLDPLRGSAVMRHRCQQAPGACRRVYFDVSIDAKPSRRIVMDLFDKVVATTGRRYSTGGRTVDSEAPNCF